MSNLVLGRSVSISSVNQYDDLDSIICSNFNKIGGKPYWLQMHSLSDVGEFSCGNCKKQMPMLIQIYAPLDNCYHRLIYVFCCKNIKCNHIANSKKTLKVIRICIEKNHGDLNDNFEGKFDTREEFLKLLDTKCEKELCRVCGFYAKESNYCSEAHRVINQVQLRAISSNKTVAPFHYSESFIDTIKASELQKVSKTVPKYIKEMMKKYKMEEKSNKFNDEDLDNLGDQILKENAAKKDKVFDKFHQEILKFPDQILRYDLNGSPLVVSKGTIPIIKCERCNSNCRFEFQIMPQIINLIYDNDHKTPLETQLDFGSIYIFTCPKCCADMQMYNEERYFIQFFDN